MGCRRTIAPHATTAVEQALTTVRDPISAVHISHIKA
jgi:hypothetical protein